MKKHLLSILCLSISTISFGQLDTLEQGFSKDFHLDFYYSYDFNEPFDNERPEFLYQYNKHNQIGINMAVAKFAFTKEKLTANLGFNFGDFPSANMAHERDLLKLLYEANVNFRFNKYLELSVGMFSSHLGFESAISYENLLTSHSLTSEWTPYYLSGVKLTYQPSKKWLYSFTLANGNQNISETAGNTSKALGAQITYCPNKKWTFNYSNFYSSDNPDSIAAYILYNNFYIKYQPSKKFDFIAGFDYAIEDDKKFDKSPELYVLSVLSRYYFSEKWAIAGRYEIYNDPDGIYFDMHIDKLEVMSYSGGLEFNPHEHLKFKLEGRVFNNSKPIFQYDQNIDPITSNTTTFIGNSSNILFSVQAKF